MAATSLSDGRSTSDPERERLRADPAAWRRFGPYLSDRQWGTVREDMSADGRAWDSFPHDHARSRAFRWGEDGLFGWSDEGQRLCLSLALWNGADAILKERLFGLSNAEGNHGEDVKELYYHLDALPSHAYMRALYKYPQRAFPYARLVEENRRRGRADEELELLDTGVFEGERYFDVEVEYAKASPDDVLLCVTATNRGPETAPLWLLPQLWFRNTWSWEEEGERPELRQVAPGHVVARHAELGTLHLFVEGEHEPLFCENETNRERFGGAPGGGVHRGPWKDAFDAWLVHDRRGAVAREPRGTKFGALRSERLAPGASVRLRLLLGRAEPERPFAEADLLLERRAAEADRFHAALAEPGVGPEERLVQRQAFAGLLWSKQVYRYDVARWLEGDPGRPRPLRSGRNADWRHLDNAEVISMPDKWEYPWYASWDLAFHCVALAHVDPELAKEQLVLFTRERYMHPNGQIPAYEWDFGNVNPPVHAWAAWRVYKIDAKESGRPDLDFLERVLHKLLLNFTWWVNRKDAHGHNLFQGGFLGLDNIGVFDRQRELGGGLLLEQADGTSWMAMYALNLLRISLELCRRNPLYQDLASKFFEHFLHIAAAMNDIDGRGIALWDEQDGFFYDVLHRSGPHGESVTALKVRSMVGLIPLFAVEVLEPDLFERAPEFTARMAWFLENRPELAALTSRWHVPGEGDRRLLSLLRGHRMKCVLRRMLDPAEFLSEHGVRSLSRHHREHPFALDLEGERHEVRYEPGVSRSDTFGGNSNWRGPVWFPVNFLILESLQRFHHYYSDDFRVECPTGSGIRLSLAEVADELGRRLASLFLRDARGRRPIYGDDPRQNADPWFRDLVLFHEFFDGDSGLGLGASHQTGWTALVAKLLRRPLRTSRET